MITEKNIFDNGMLISLNMGSYVGRKKLSKEQLKDLPTEIVRGVHDLFDLEFKKQLEEIQSFDWQTRHMTAQASIPFPLDGVYFISSKRIESLIEQLEEKRKERIKMITAVADQYEEAITKFAVKYPEYYKGAKDRYPSKQEFVGRFYFKYQFIKIAPPDKDSKFVTPEMYKLEMKKFRESIEEMKKEVLGIIQQSLLESTERLKKQCADGKPNQRTLDTLNTFLSRVDEVYSDFIDREDVKTVIGKIKKQILGVDADSLREDEKFKEKFGKAIKAITNEIKALPDIPLKRAIDF